GQPALLGDEVAGEVWPAVVIQRVPDREGDAEEALAADVPVRVEPFDPGLEPRLHVGRVPAQLLAPRQEVVPEIERPDEPLPAGDDLERTLAPLVELHRVGDRAGLAHEVAGGGEQLDDTRSGPPHRKPLELAVGAAGSLGVVALPTRRSPRQRLEAAVPTDHGPHGEP